MEFLPFFSFLDEYIEKISKHEPFPVDEIHCSGGRASGKSDNLGALFLTRALNTIDEITGEIVPASGLVLKKVKNTLNTVFNEYTRVAKDAETPPKARRYDFTWLFPGSNNYVQFVGWKNSSYQTTGGKQGAGREALYGEYVIIVIEETYEFTAAERQAMKEAIRSGNRDAKILFVYICNPWFPNHEYIQFLNHFLPYNKFLLGKQGYQFRFCKINEYARRGMKTPENYKERKYLFIHCNYKINPFLSDSYITGTILNSRFSDPDTADTTIYGVPGYTSASCYGKVIDKIGEADWHEPKEYFLCGGDIGLGGDKQSVTAFTFAGYNRESYFDILGLYVWNNKTYRKPPQEIGEEVITFYENCVAKYLQCTGIDLKTQPYPLFIRVDKIEVAFISMLNEIAQKKEIDWLQFQPCSKYPVNDRVNTTNFLLHNNLFRVDYENCKPLLDEMSNAVWDNRPNVVTQKRKDKNDHCLNAMEYGMEQVMYEIYHREH